jgi:hypothetical protein
MIVWLRSCTLDDSEDDILLMKLRHEADHDGMFGHDCDTVKLWTCPHVVTPYGDSFVGW